MTSLGWVARAGRRLAGAGRVEPFHRVGADEVGAGDRGVLTEGGVGVGLWAGFRLGEGVVLVGEPEPFVTVAVTFKLMLALPSGRRSPRKRRRNFSWGPIPTA